MNNTKKSLKVLFIGESWHIHMIHSKGYDSFTSSKYEEGATWLLQCLKNSQVDVTYWICPYISRHLLSLNPLQARCRRYS
ncbi:glutamine amidotransferase, partial [Escherichia coli]